MTPAGYSNTALARKLGIKEGMVVGVSGAPTGFTALLHPLPDRVRLTGGRAHVDMAICFSTRSADLKRRVDSAMRRISADGAIWTAWPKKASKLPTDLTEDRLRDLFLPSGMVDVKVCAIDETWSGLRFVVRKAVRPTWNQ